MSEEQFEQMKTAVRAATKDAFDKGKLGVASAIYGVPEWKLRDFALGLDSALCEAEIRFLAGSLLERAR